MNKFKEILQKANSILALRGLPLLSNLADTYRGVQQRNTELSIEAFHGWDYSSASIKFLAESTGGILSSGVIDEYSEDFSNLYGNKHISYNNFYHKKMIEKFLTKINFTLYNNRFCSYLSGTQNTFIILAQVGEECFIELIQHPAEHSWAYDSSNNTDEIIELFSSCSEKEFDNLINI